MCEVEVLGSLSVGSATNSGEGRFDLFEIRRKGISFDSELVDLTRKIRNLLEYSLASIREKGRQ